MSLNRPLMRIPYASLSIEIQSQLSQRKIAQNEWELKLSTEEQHNLVTQVALTATSALPLLRSKLDTLPCDLQGSIIDFLYPREHLDVVNQYKQADSETLALLQELPVNLDAKSLYRENITFFGNVAAITAAQTKLATDRAALQAAQHLLMDEPHLVEQLLKENLAIKDCIVEITDPKGNRVKGNLLWLAALTGNFNFREPNVPEAHYGIFEKLSFYYSPEEVAKVAEAVNSAEWKAETARRMKPYQDAVAVFLQKIIDARAEDDAALQVELQAAIEEFKNALKPDASEVISLGYIFDLQVIADAAAAFETKVQELGGWFSDKSDLFWVVGIGSLQHAKASKCDERVIQKGVGNVVNGQVPDRFIKRDGNNSYSGQAAGDGTTLILGSDFFWGLYGVVRAVGAVRRYGAGCGVGSVIQNLCRTKTSACSKFMLQPGKQSNWRCVIL